MKNQTVTDASLGSSFTAASDLEIVEAAAQAILPVIHKWRRNRLFYLKQESSWGLWIDGRRGKSLSFTVRVSYQPSKKQPSKSFLLLDFTQYPLCLEDPKIVVSKAAPKEKLSKWRELNKRIKDLTIQVGLLSKKRSRYQQIYRKVEKNRLSQGETQWRWKPIFVNPKDLDSDIHRHLCLHLLLYLKQERMINEDVDQRLLELVKKCFKIADTGHAILVTDGLLKNFTLPEDWRAIINYVGRLRRQLRHQGSERTEKEGEVLNLTQRKLEDLFDARPHQESPRKALMKYLTETKEMKHDSARKHVYRQLRKGKSIEEIAKQVLLPT